MEFRQVRYFLAICDHMNFTKAAAASGVTQPALTKAIQKLEDELGGALFIRDKGRFELTELGRTMRTHFAVIEETRDAARRAARSITELDMVQLNIGIMCTIGPSVLGPALAAFQECHQGVELLLHDVWSKKGHELLLAGALDCALMARHQPPDPKFDAVPLYREPFVLALAASHPLARQPSVRFADLAGCAYADRLRCEFRQVLIDRIEPGGFTVDIVMRSEREDWIQVAVAQGHGISMMPLYSISATGIVARTIDDLAIEREIEALTVRDRPVSPALKTFLGFLESYPWQPPADALACLSAGAPAVG